ncbi:MAG TPA: hypothetical protein VN823_22795 [Stellaceae bacterium]|nr:hypothetical protein [Stellaceae bacterium]
MTSRPLALAAAIACALWSSGARAEDAAQVDATLRYNGQALKLTKVLVLQNGNEEGLEDGPRLRVFLSDGDIPVTVAGAAGILRAKTYARDAHINGVVILADPTGRSSDATASLLNAPGLEPGSFASVTSTSAFAALKVTASRASGSASIDDAPLELKAKFDAPLNPDPVTSDLKGKAALGSAPVQALIAFRDALRKGDMAAVAKYATAARQKEIGDFRAKSGDAAFREALKQAPDGASVTKTIKRLVVRGTTASVVIEGGEVAELVQEGGAWKVD